MILPDVNVLVYAYRADSERHKDFKSWLDGTVNGEAAFGISEQVLSGLVRITTHPRIFANPDRVSDVLAFAAEILSRDLCRVVRPSSNHWRIFSDLCAEADARGNLVTDAWYAALAIESGSTWITADRDFARFPGLTWRHPLDHPAPVTNPG